MFYNNRGFYPSTLGGMMTKPKINWGNLLGNTQKTLGIINQSIPIFYQIKPIWNNAKTMFRVMGELKDTPNQNNKSQKKETLRQVQNSSSEKVESSNDNSPNFFL